MPITTAAPEERSAAFELALRHLGEDVRPARVLNALSLVAAGEISSEGIFVARGPEGLRGVQICVPLPGASGLFWLPRTRPVDAGLENQLVHFALDWLGERGTKLAQAFLSPEDSPGSGPLLHCGFQAVTRPPLSRTWPGSVSPPLPAHRDYILVPIRKRIGSFFTRPLCTYEATQDCPELNGVRTIEEIIAGHHGQSGYHPDRWWLACEGNRPVGVAMVNEITDVKAWDLSYLGIVPEARGRGLGRELAGHVLRTAQNVHRLRN